MRESGVCGLIDGIGAVNAVVVLTKGKGFRRRRR
jgi:hypothetical protein